MPQQERLVSCKTTLNSYQSLISLQTTPAPTHAATQCGKAGLIFQAIFFASIQSLWARSLKWSWPGPTQLRSKRLRSFWLPRSSVWRYTVHIYFLITFESSIILLSWSTKTRFCGLFGNWVHELCAEFLPSRPTHSFFTMISRTSRTHLLT